MSAGTITAGKFRTAIAVEYCNAWCHAWKNVVCCCRGFEAGQVRARVVLQRYRWLRSMEADAAIIFGLEAAAWHKDRPLAERDLVSHVVGVCEMLMTTFG